MKTGRARVAGVSAGAYKPPRLIRRMAGQGRRPIVLGPVERISTHAFQGNAAMDVIFDPNQPGAAGGKGPSIEEVD